jgi:hypothetical protein
LYGGAIGQSILVRSNRLIFGILGGVFALLMESIGNALGADYGLYANAFAAIIFSVIGMSGAALETKRWLGGGLMLIGAFGVLISISLYGLLTFILFLIGAIITFATKKPQAVTQRVEPEMTGYGGGQ